jgi:hypothetical protein
MAYDCSARPSIAIWLLRTTIELDMPALPPSSEVSFWTNCVVAACKSSLAACSASPRGATAPGTLQAYRRRVHVVRQLVHAGRGGSKQSVTACAPAVSSGTSPITACTSSGPRTSRLSSRAVRPSPRANRLSRVQAIRQREHVVRHRVQSSVAARSRPSARARRPSAHARVPQRVQHIRERVQLNRRRMHLVRRAVQCQESR